jgi:hypothetical protein
MEIKVGDLVRIRDYDWISRDVGVVIEVRELVHDMTDERYMAVTALVGNKQYTFSAADFTVISPLERKEN